MADETFTFEVKTEVAKADAAIGRVEDKLDHVEKKAEQVGKAIDGAFLDKRGRLRDAQNRFLGVGGAATKASSEVHGFGKTMGSTAKDGDALDRALARVQEQLKREETVLKQIRGPFKDYLADMQALHSIHTKGLISAREYAHEVRKLNNQIAAHQGIKMPGGGARGGGDKPGGIRGGLGDALSNTGTVAGSALGNVLNSPLGKAGAIGAIVAATVALTVALASMGEEYLRLQNRLRVVTSSQEELNSTFKRLQTIARNTRMDLATTTEGYVRMKLATRELGLSSEDVFKFTERLNKAIKVSGAAGQEASAGMMQLSQGLASGRLSGDELRSVLENLPYVADIIAKHMGVTRGELRKLGSEGKISAQTVVDAFATAAPEIEKEFGKTAPTLTESWQAFKDRMMVAIGSLVVGSGFFEKLGDVLESLAASLVTFIELIGAVKGGLEAIPGVKSEDENPFQKILSKVSKKGAIPAFIDSLKELRDVLDTDAQEAEKAANALRVLNDIADKAASAEARHYKMAQTTKAMRAAGMDEGDLKFDEEFANKMATLKATMAHLGVTMPEVFTKTRTRVAELSLKVEDLVKQKAAEKMAEDARKLYKQIYGINDALDAQSKRWQDNVDKVKELEEALSKIHGQKDMISRKVQGDGKAVGSNVLAVGRAELEIRRQLRDARIEQNLGDNAYGATVIEAKKRTNEYKDSLDDLRGAFKSGLITTKEYTEGLKALGVEESRLEKLFKAIREPQTNFIADTKALDELFARGRITLGEYVNKLNELRDAYAGKEIRELLDSVGGDKPKPRGQPIGPQGGIADGLFDDALESFGDVASPERIKSMEEYGQQLIKARQEIEAIKSDGPNLEADLKHHTSINEELERRNELTRKWRQELERIKAQDTDAQMVAGIKNGINEIKSSWDVAAQSQRVIVEGYKAMENALVDFVLSGRDGFASLEESGRKMVSMLLAELTRLIVFKALAGLFGGGPAVGPKIPGFAGGGKMIVGGSGGTDSQLVAFRASPGETVTTTRPGQGGKASGANSGGSDRPIVIKAITITDPNAAIHAMDTRRGQRLTVNTITSKNKLIRSHVSRA